MTTTTEAPALIGTIQIDDQLWEIDWPFVWHEDSSTSGPEREDFAVVLLDGEEVGDFVHPDWLNGKELSNVPQIMLLAAKYIAAREFDTEEKENR